LEKACLEEAIERLPERARCVLIRRYGLDDRLGVASELSGELWACPRSGFATCNTKRSALLGPRSQSGIFRNVGGSQLAGLRYLNATFAVS
jgi:hypothetical protein